LIFEPHGSGVNSSALRANTIAARTKKGAANGTFLYYRQLLLKLRSGDADRP
jgi:hypothetical protein